jgi:4-amino-4-deoxy-L-arabinose transferase-like glycosyltransferase
LPWSVVVLRNAARLRDQLRSDGGHYVGFFLSWLVVPLVFFSISTSKRPQYMLPLIPAAAFLCAHAWRHRKTFEDTRATAITLGAIGIFFLTMHDRIGSWVSASVSVAPVIPTTAIALGAVCLVAGTLVGLGSRSRGLVLLGLTLPVASIPIVGTELMQGIGTDRSAKHLASAIQHAAGDAVEVVAVATFPTSLPFYLGRTVVVATDDGAEITSNYLLRFFDDWKNAPTLRPGAWWREALVECRRPRVFVTSVEDRMARAELGAALPIIAATRKYAAFGPCGVTQFAARP